MDRKIKSRLDRFEEIPQNIKVVNRKCEKLGDKQLECEGLIYICYVPQEEWGEHGRVKEYWGPKGTIDRKEKGVTASRVEGFFGGAVKMLLNQIEVMVSQPWGCSKCH